MSRGIGPLRIAIEDWFETFNPGKALHRWFDDFTKSTRVELRGILQPLFDLIDTVPYLPQWIKNTLDTAREGGEVVSGTLLLSFLIGLGMGVVNGIMQPVTGIVSSYIAGLLETAIFSLPELRALSWRHPELQEKIDREAWRSGHDKELSAGMEDIQRPHLDVPTLFTLWLRGVVTNDHLETGLKSYGWQDKDIAYLKELQWPIPGPGDLISMAVREAFTDTTAAKFGYDEDFPPDFAHYAAMQGVTGDWAKRYWRAHWTLPSTRSGYEMLHRQVIDKPTLELLLRTADIPKFWRDKLIAISYATYTRVDIRRMYSIGVFKTAAEVHTAYMDIGYDEDKALKLTEFTLREYGEETRDASKGDVLIAYELGRLTSAEALGLLESIEYPRWIAEAYLARVDLKRANKLASDLIKSVKTLYTGGQISRTDLVTKLSTIPLPANEIDRYIEEWDITRKAKTRRPSRTDLRKMFLANILDEDDFRKELSGHGLSPTYVTWYIDQAKYDLAELARKENEAAMKEADRLLTAAVKTDLDVELSGYDVLIAQANLAIADIKLSMYEGMSVQGIDQSKRAILAYKVMIADFRGAKAELRQGYLIEKQQEA